MPEPAAPSETDTTRGRRVLRAVPWIGILVLTGAVQFIRDAPTDGLIFLVVAAALVADAVRPFASWRRPPVSRTLAWLVAAGVGVALTLLPRHGLGEGIVVVAVGATALIYAWPPRPASDAPASSSGALRRTGILWAVTALAVCIWELTSFVLGRTAPGGVVEHPAISDLVDPTVDTWWGHALFVAAWLAFGMLLIVPWRRR